MERPYEEILNECIERVLAGASVQAVLADYPEHESALAPALRDAQLLMRSGPLTPPETLARTQAQERMLADLDAARLKANEFQPVAAAAVMDDAPASARATAPSRGGWLASFMRRSTSFRAAAVAGSVALFGVLGVGAAAATGNAPEPVRDFFRSSATTGLRVELEGVITAVDAQARTLDVDVGGDVRTVLVVDDTELSRGGDAITFDQFAVGAPVEVKGALQPDDTIIATRIHLEDDDDDGDADDDATPGATSTTDDGDEDDDEDGDDNDNSGPGNGNDDDQGDDEDDDADDNDNSGPGDGDDDDGDDEDEEDADDEDNSGPGDGDEDDEDDDADDDENSGPGDGDDDGDEDDNSGPGDDGDDDEDEDDDNSGSDDDGD